MKKTNREKKEWQKRKQLKIINKQIKATNKSSGKKVITGALIISPYMLCIYDDHYYEDAINFFKKISRKILKEKKKITIDFSRLESVTAAAILCLYAEIHRCIQLSEIDHPIRYIKPRHAEPRRVLNELKFFAGINNPSYDVIHEGTIGVIPCTSGTKADNKLDDLMNSIENNIYGGEINEEGDNTLYRSLSEAMLNVWQHAYKSSRIKKDEIDRLGKRWWILGHRIEDNLYLAIYDRGIGIPEALPFKYTKEVIDKFLDFLKLKNRSDANMIHAAMEIGRTGTGKQGRGKGLQDVRRFVEENPSGVLRIYSNRGGYVYRMEGDKIEHHSRKHSLRGTLIQWNVKLTNNSSEIKNDG